MKKLNLYGFSIIEILVAIMILTILSLLMAPVFSKLKLHANAEIVMQQLLRTISFARSVAIGHGDAVIFCGSPDQLHCNEQWVKSFLVKDSNKIFARVKFKGKLHWRGSLGLSYLKFLPSGLINAENGVFWYCDDVSTKIHWAITINHAGRARIIWPNGDGVIEDYQGGELSC